MWVFLFLFSIQQQKDTQSIEGVTFSSLFYSNFPLVMDHGYPILEVYCIEKNVVFMASWKEKFSFIFWPNLLAYYYYIHAFSKGA